jgi:hypothetical protein
MSPDPAPNSLLAFLAIAHMKSKVKSNCFTVQKENFHVYKRTQKEPVFFLERNDWS